MHQPCEYAAPTEDETLERYVEMTKQTNLVALDKTLIAIRRSSGSYLGAAVRLSTIAERMVLAVHEIGMTLPENQRVGGV